MSAHDNEKRLGERKHILRKTYSLVYRTSSIIQQNVLADYRFDRLEIIYKQCYEMQIWDNSISHVVNLSKLLKELSKKVL